MGKKESATATTNEQLDELEAAEAQKTFMANQPPVISPLILPDGHPGNLWTYQVNATDPDNDPISFSLLTAPSGMTIGTSSGTIYWSPQWYQLGSHTVIVRATDSHGATDNETGTVSIGNQAPQCTCPGSQTVHPGDYVTFQVTAGDPDADPLTYTLISPPAGAIINGSSGVLYWTPSWNQLGTHTIRVRVSDPGGAFSECTCTITVANAAPVLDNLPPVTAHPGSLVTFQANATDPDGDPITYGLVSAPSGATINPSSGIFSWTPNWSQVATHQVMVRASDPAAHDQKACQITVANAAPNLASLSNHTGHPYQPVSFQAQATDPDGDNVTYSLVSAPSGAMINPSTGAFNWTPSPYQLGVHPVTVRATDPGGLLDQDTCQVTVSNP